MSRKKFSGTRGMLVAMQAKVRRDRRDPLKWDKIDSGMFATPSGVYEVFFNEKSRKWDAFHHDTLIGSAPDPGRAKSYCQTHHFKG